MANLRDRYPALYRDGQSLDRTLRLAALYAEREGDKESAQRVQWIGYAPSYAEPGYGGLGDTVDAVILGNWNAPDRGRSQVIPALAEALEEAGCGVEWSDEWTTCDGCGGAVRAQPDSFSWSPFYVITEDGELLCLDCLADNPVCQQEEHQEAV